jgi:hypothetical protein
VEPGTVCTLPPRALRERIAWIRDEVLVHARSTERSESGLAWELDAAPGLVEKLERLIALERDCCSGLVFEQRRSTTPGRVRLEIRGLDPEGELVQQLRAPPLRRSMTPISS